MTTRKRFLDQVEDSRDIVTGAKIDWGGPETGKSHDAYENLPRPLIAIDSDVSSALFADERFEGFKRLGPDKIPRPRDAHRVPRGVHERPAVVPHVQVAAHRLAHPVRGPQGRRARDRQLVRGADGERGGAAGRRAQPGARRAGRAQADWARIAKELTRLVRKVSALGVHVYVVAEERTRFQGNRPGDGEEGAKSSLSPKKFTHAFDLILQKTDKGEVVVRKSRYRKWRKDQRVAGYRAAKELLPILTGAEQKAAGLEDFDPATNAHDELLELLKTLGSDARGGAIPVAKMRAYLETAKNNELPEAEVRRVINEVKRAYGESRPKAA